MTKDSVINERYLLCRPRNGLNDTFVQIERCWRHAETFDRILVIDPTNSASLTNLSSFFLPRSPSPRVQFHISPGQVEYLNTLPCQPIALTGRLSDYNVIMTKRGKNGRIYRDAKTNTPLQVDLSHDYPEPLILHDSGGGGNESFEFLKRVKLEPNLALDIREKINELGSDYAAVHIRHSDLKTNWRKFLKSIRSALRGRTVLICSDSAEVIKAAPQILKNSTVRTVTELVYTDGQAQHHRLDADIDSRNATTRAALVDLMALGASSDLYITPHEQGNTSGFARLAASICRDKTILNSLLGADIFQEAGATGQVHVIISLAFRLKWHLRRCLQNLPFMNIS